MVIGICSVAGVTYLTSALFIFYLSDIIAGNFGISGNGFIIATFILGIFWCGVLGYFGAGLIVKPLQRLEQAANKVAEGDIRNNIDLPKSDDELRSLAIAYNHMINNLRDMVKEVNANFSATNEKVIEMKESSSAAAQQAVNISQTIEEIASGAEGSANAIQKTAGRMEEVTEMANEVQNHAQSSDKLSKEMVTSLKDSRHIVESLVRGIQQLAKENETSLSSVHRLETNATKVGEIISLVGDIAEQTNLLALNASIEAARAGEQGKGFAVVADEVRKLADESGQAVKGISELVKNMQKEVAQVVTQITNQVSAANSEADKGAKTNDAITGMAASVNGVSQSIGEILQLVDKQMLAIQATTNESQDVAAIAEQTSAGASDVTSSTQEQKAVMEEIAASAEVLLDQANDLKKTIRRFTIN
jgi:methyl-accepting chemotaxis protein